MFSESSAVEPNSRIQTLDTPTIESVGSGSILVDGRSVGVAKWGEILEFTAREASEFGVVISRRGSELLTSKVFRGTRQGFTAPLFPQGFKSLLPGTKDQVLVHSHYLPPESDHLDRSPLSDEDIQSFIHSSLNALVVVDRGGAQILTNSRTHFGDIDVDPNIVKDALQEAVKQKGGTMDLMKIVAKNLEAKGIGYYYTNELTQSPEGYVKFDKVS